MREKCLILLTFKNQISESNAHPPNATLMSRTC